MIQKSQRLGILVFACILSIALGHWVGSNIEDGTSLQTNAASTQDKSVTALQTQNYLEPHTTEPAATINSDSQPGPLITLWENTAKTPWKVRATPLSAADWHITGVVKRGKQTQIIVQFDDDPAPHMLKVGDNLPGGAVLSWIKSDAIGVITQDQQLLRLPLFERNDRVESLSNPPTPTPK